MSKSTTPAVRSIDELKRQYEELNKRKIQTQTQLETVTKQLEDLQNEAVEKFGTSNIEELTAKLASMESENERRRQEYQLLLDGIQQELTKVEQAGLAETSGIAPTSAKKTDG